MKFNFVSFVDAVNYSRGESNNNVMEGFLSVYHWHFLQTPRTARR